MGKKSKKTVNASASPVIEQAITDQGNKKKGLISDTTCSGLGKTSWQSTYNLIEAEEPEATTVEATVDTTQKSEGTLKDLADSFLHRIAAREQILPYTDVVRWAIEELPITDRTFCTRDGRVFGSFQANDLRQMYHLPEPEKKYNKAFLEKFRSENETESEPIRNWRQNPAKHKHKSSGMYSVDSLCSPYCYAGIMMCRLWGLHDSSNFTIEMVPLMEAACNSEIMDWGTILSDKLATAVLDFRGKTRISERFISPFYYSAYILDTLCFNSEFPVLGWRWTPKEPMPIHIYYQKLWKTSHRHHLYQICNGFMLPIHYSIFDKPAPKISYQAGIDLTGLGRWFAEEKFTYIRIFGSQAKPHVLPLYIPDKLLAREIAYQIISEGVTQTLKRNKKQVWPSFPLRCGVYTLNDLKHAEKEALKMKSLTLATLPNRHFDPDKVAYNALEQAKLAKFDHKEDMFDDLFSTAESMSQVRSLARMKYQNEGLVEFNRLRAQRLQTLPLDLLETSPAAESNEPEQRHTKEPLVVTNGQEKMQEKTQTKEQEQSIIKINQDTQIDPELLQEWQQFDSIINNPEGSKEAQAARVADMQENVLKQIPGETSGLPSSKGKEIIPKDPSDQVILQIEEIPPLDVFYSPKHKAVVKRQRKRKRTDQPSLFPELTVTGNVIWKEEFDPSEDLTKLSQFAGAYSAATIDKASEVSLLLKTRDQDILLLQTQLSEARQKAEQAELQLLTQQQTNNQLTQQLQEERQRIDQSAVQKQKELSEALAQLKTANEQMLKMKDEQIAQISAQLEKTKNLPQVAEFRAEAVQINKALLTQIKLLCQQIAQAEPLCDLTTTLSNKSANAIADFEQADETVTNYLEWQSTEEGQSAKLPKILESHKEILFIEWQSQLNKAERAISRCKLTTSNLVELINDTLYLSNMISQCTPGKLTSAKTLEQSCYSELEKTGRLIAGINSLTWDTYWMFLVKPYSQRASLKCLSDAIGCIIPEMQDATYDAQLNSRLNRPPEVEPMLAICQLRTKDEQPK